MQQLFLECVVRRGTAGAAVPRFVSAQLSSHEATEVIAAWRWRGVRDGHRYDRGRTAEAQDARSCEYVRVYEHTLDEYVRQVLVLFVELLMRAWVTFRDTEPDALK